MGPFRVSTRVLIVAVAIIGFDAASMTRAVQMGRAAHSGREYAIGFGLVLLVLNLVGFGLLASISRRAKAGSSKRGRLAMRPSPLMMVGFYVVVVSVAILSVLFFAPGRF